MPLEIFFSESKMEGRDKRKWNLVPRLQIYGTTPHKHSVKCSPIDNMKDPRVSKLFLNVSLAHRVVNDCTYYLIVFNRCTDRQSAQIKIRRERVGVSIERRVGTIQHIWALPRPDIRASSDKK